MRARVARSRTLPPLVGAQADAVGLLGCGHAVPQSVRKNDDPLFARLRLGARAGGVSEADLFTGMHERRVLGPGETLATLMAEAGRRALAAADCPAERIDRLYGYGYVAEFVTPNVLFAVHAELGLSPRAMVYPVQCEFTNFIAALLAAWEAVLAGHCQTALVVCGTGWSRNMDYANPHALTIGDGAGAAVVGRGGTLQLVDFASETDSSEYGAMTMAYRPVPPVQPPADWDGAPLCTYHIAEAGIAAFLHTGMAAPPRVVGKLLAAHGLRGADVALFTHQASRRLLHHWRAAIAPAEYPDTFDSLGNLGLASVPVTLALHLEGLRSGHLVLLQLGVGGQVCALLLRGGSPRQSS